MIFFRKNKKLIWILLVALFCLNTITWIIVYDLSRPKALEIIFFDVGQGDSIFIETPQRYQILIDGGPDLSVLEKLAKEMPFYDRTIDLIILTHPDHDHLFGLLEVLKRYKVKNILWTGVNKDSAEFKEWERLIENEARPAEGGGAKLLIAQAGQKVFLSENIYLSVLHPFESLEGQEFEYYNDTSIVAKLVFEDTAFLFTGDISNKIEKKLTDVDSDILKVAHHGSKFSSAEEFLEAVSPELAVISVGENNYGQPDLGTLANLEKLGIKALITKELGDIKLISDGEKIYEKY